MSTVAVFCQIPDTTLGVLADVFHEARLSWHRVDWFDTPPEPREPDDLAGLVILGGTMNADDVRRYPFLTPEVAWIRRAVRAGVPVLGICLGSQLLAKALGATVRANGRKEIGWYPIELTDAARQDALMAGCSREQIVYQFHGDTFTLPKGSVHLARSSWCENQAFRFGRCVWGLQFHIEVTAEMAVGWLDQPDNRRMIAELDYVDPEQVRRQTPEAIKTMHAFGRRILPRFATMCSRRTRGEEG